MLWFFQFSACIEGKCEPLVARKDIYIGTVPVSPSEMHYFTTDEKHETHSAWLTMNAQSVSNLSMTEIIAAAAILEPVKTTQPTAPSMQTINRSESISEFRPPPFSPSYRESPTLLPSDQESPTLLPSAPSS